MQVKGYYSGAQIALHWAIALLIVANYFVSDGMGDAFDARLEGRVAGGIVPGFHVYAGVAVLVLALIRLGLRLGRGTPPAHSEGVPGKVAGLAHLALYGLMVAVPALGALTWFGGVEAAGDLHVLAMDVMMLLALVHAGAALFHHYVLKDGLLRRMTRAG